MKKFRCPWCGDESIDFYNKTVFSYYKSIAVNKCPSCNRGIRPDENFFSIPHIIGSILMIILLILSLTYNKAYILLFIFTFLIMEFLIMPLYRYKFTPLLKYSTESEEVIPFDIQMRIKINYGHIKNGEILALKFQENIYPAVFRKNFNSEYNQYDVGFIRFDEVPEKSLFIGNYFVIVDNGKEVAGGEIISRS